MKENEKSMFTSAYLALRLVQLVPQLGVLPLQELNRIVVNLNGTFQLINLRSGTQRFMMRIKIKL